MLSGALNKNLRNPNKNLRNLNMRLFSSDKHLRPTFQAVQIAPMHLKSLNTRQSFLSSSMVSSSNVSERSFGLALHP